MEKKINYEIIDAAKLSIYIQKTNEGAGQALDIS